MDILCSYAHIYQDLYKQNIMSVFHVAVGCVVGQQVAFKIGRNIRKRLYELCGFPVDKQLILETDLSQINNLTPLRITLLKKMAKIDDDRDINIVLDDYVKLNGFGKWTYDAVGILVGVNNNINLSSDSYIRKNLSLYTGLKLTQKECHEYILKANNDQTSVCYLLWRIKPQSINKITYGLELTQADFV